MTNRTKLKLPLVSVCVVCYNHAPFLRACLDSVLRQTYPHLQLIIVAVELFFPGGVFIDHRVCRGGCGWGWRERHELKGLEAACLASLRETIGSMKNERRWANDGKCTHTCTLPRDAPDLSHVVRTAASMDADSLADEFETVDGVSTPFTILTSQLRSAGPATSIQYGSEPRDEKVFGRSKFNEIKTSEALIETPSSLIKLNYKFASHVVFYLSATNWDAVFFSFIESCATYLRYSCPTNWHQ